MGHCWCSARLYSWCQPFSLSQPVSRKHLWKIPLQRVSGISCAVALIPLSATADSASAMLINQGDKIWDAVSSQGNLVLKGKYKESPENGIA